MNSTAAIVIVGNEILSGRTRDKNAWWLACELKKLGVVLRRIVVIPDVIEEIVREVNAVRAQVDYVMVCGGIGPTPDDVTRQAISVAVGLPCVRHAEAAAILVDRYKERLTERSLVMADLPEGAALIYNPQSGAPGCHVENIFVLPGVPELLEQMFPQIASMMRHGTLVEREMAAGLGESLFADLMEDAIARFPETDIGSYPSLVEGKWHCSLVVKGSEQAKVDEAYQWLQENLARRAKELGR